MSDLRYAIILLEVTAEAVAHHGKTIGDRLGEEAERFLEWLFRGGK